MLEARTVVATLFDANCYILWDSESKSALVVDPGPGTTARVLDVLAENDLQLGAILLTHGHGDHVWEAERLSASCGVVPVHMSEPDMFFLEDPARILGIIADKFGMGPWQKPTSVQAIKQLSFAPVSGISVRMIPTPGHSPGSALFLIGAEGLGSPTALSGDVVFAGTVGRTDLPGGDENEMRQSLRTLGNVLDPLTTLLPGHGPQTTWAKEMESNPYVVRACRVG